MTTMKKFFELTTPYKFDPTDLTALIYLTCTVLGMMGYNVTPLFCVGAVIGTAFCWTAHRINLIVLNVALLVFNLYNLFAMWG